MGYPVGLAAKLFRNGFGQHANRLAPNVPLSGGVPFDPSTFVPNPRPQTPFMPPPMSGGNLGFPSGAPLGATPAGPLPPGVAYGNSMPPVAEIPGQTAAYNQMPGTTAGPTAMAPGRAFNPQMFNLGLGLMQRGGSQMAGLAQYLPSIFKMGR